MLELVPKGLFSRNFLLRTPGQKLVEIAASGWRERCEFTLQGSRYRMYRERAMSGDFLLERDGTIFARGTKPSAWREAFELDLGGRKFQLRKRSMWKREFFVTDGDKEVGQIRPASSWTRRTLVELPADWPLPFQLFVFWLALLMWRRAESE